MRICICGGGSLGNVIAAWTAAHKFATTDIYTGNPEKWSHTITAHTPEGDILKGETGTISNDPAIVTDADIVLLCYPGYLIAPTLKAIGPYLKPHTYVGSVFSATGFFFEAQKYLNSAQPLWGFQRVPFIARVRKYGHSADLLGYKSLLKIAVENVSEADKQKFAATVEQWFKCPVSLLTNYYEATLSNSNPLLHPARIYSLFGGENEGRAYPHRVLFYKEWTDTASELLIAMDRELFRLLEVLPVTQGFLPEILDYYESSDAASLTAKIKSIPAFQGIESPMVQGSDGLFRPDTASRYFTEDFPYGLRIVHDLAHRHNIHTPTIDHIYSWGLSMIQKNNNI